MAIIKWLNELITERLMKINQPVIFDADPNKEKVVPLNLNKPCIAYSLNGARAMYGWDVKKQIWQ